MVERFGEFGIYQRDKDQEIIRPKGGDEGVIYYALDVPIGIYSGLSKAVQGLLQLGAMPVDYLANTNLLSGI